MADSDFQSSPARPTLHHQLTMLSSSPVFPDVKDLVAKKPRPQTLRTGSGAAPIPENATKTFTSAGHLLRAAKASANDSLDTIDEPERPPPTKKPTACLRKSTKTSKRVAKEVIILSSDGATPAVASNDTTDINVAAFEAETRPQNHIETAPLKAKPWKKFKTSSDENHEAEHEEAVAAKPRARKQKSKPETVSRHFSRETSAPKEKVIKKAARVSTPEPINLEPALQRRTDWTPSKDTFNNDVQNSPSDDENASTNAPVFFKMLHDAYSHKATDLAYPTLQQSPVKVLGKRKIIEMVPVGKPPEPDEPAMERQQRCPVKEKAPKKKPRTITEIATAAYAPKPTEHGGEQRKEESFLLDYLDAQGTEQGTSKKAAAKHKPKKATKTMKKTTARQRVLLSPESAMRLSAGQDFVFGTSSQLAREQSPTLLRDLQTALRASNVAEENDPFATPISAKDSKTKNTEGKSLWSISARDEDGDVMDGNIIDLVNAPEFPEDNAILDPRVLLPQEPVVAETNSLDDSSLIEIASRPTPTVQTDNSSQPSIPKSHFFATQRKMTVNSVAAAMSPEPLTPSFPPVADFLDDDAPPPSNQHVQDEVSEPPSATLPRAQNARPEYELFTDAKLAKEISSYGFKPVKSRTGMIALLDQCWRSKIQAPFARAPFSTSTVLAGPKNKRTATQTARESSTSPAKRPRGRAQKANPRAAEAADVSQKKRGQPKKDAVSPTGKARKKAAASSMPPPPKPQAGPSTPKRKKAASRKAIGELNSDDDSSAGLTSPEHLFSPEVADVSLTEDTEISLTSSPTKQQSALFKHITKAVTSARRTTDPSNPSWHEKMLMYDPIILEDLSAWLNSGQLTRVGYDKEVAPEDVKKWCESRSICCLWRVNVHGKERKRF